MRTTDTTPSTCQCGYRVEYATDLDSDNQPRPGDPSVCLRCGRINRFNHELAIEPMPREDVRNLPLDVQYRLREWQRRIREMHNGA